MTTWSTHMLGLVFDGEKAEIRDDLEVRAPGPTEVKVQVVAAGLCHSDISVIDGTIPWQYPCVLGHEGAGIVAEVGRGRHQREARRPRGAAHARVLRPVQVLRDRPAGALPQEPRATRASRSPLAGEPAWNFAGASFFSEYSGGAGEPVREDRRRRRPLGRLPHRLRRAHRHRLGVEPHRPRSRRHLPR